MFLVRIKPHLPVNSYNEFFKEKGWYAVGPEKAEWCRSRRINDQNPQADLVFDVKVKDEARAIAETEQKMAEPAGTPEDPIVLGGIAGAVSAGSAQTEGDAGGVIVGIIGAEEPAPEPGGGPDPKSGGKNKR